MLDVDGYERTVAGVRIEGIRTGKGNGPNHVLAIVNDDFTLSSCDIGFPMRNRSIIGDRKLVIAHIDAAPPGSQWRGVALEPGALFAYGPRAEHTAVNLPGLKFTFVVVDLEALANVAGDAGVGLELPGSGDFVELEQSRHTRHIGRTFRALELAASRGKGIRTHASHAVLSAMAMALRHRSRLRCGQPRYGGIDSGHVVHLCIDYARKAECIPSMSELCLAASVSERRLRQAFTDEFDMPPSQFFRDWALAAAHRHLQSAADTDLTVTDIATSIGFGHLGRFAAAYQALYGETPSTTLCHSRDHAAN